jgi:uncharacterized cupin superfamily protein
MTVERWPPGSDLYPEHAEPEHEEVYIVLEGSALFRAGDEEHVLEPGVVARVGPA